MDTQENKDGKECCTKGKCCGCKALAAIALLAVGGIGGYLCGRHCGATQCTTPPAVQAPAK